MEGKMTKEEVISTTIDSLMDISVPVKLEEQITNPIKGAIRNLLIVLEMCRVEREANERTADSPLDEDKTPGSPGVLCELKPEDDELYGDGEEEPETGKPENHTIALSGSTERANEREGGETDGQPADIK